MAMYTPGESTCANESALLCASSIRPPATSAPRHYRGRRGRREDGPRRTRGHTGDQPLRTRRHEAIDADAAADRRLEDEGVDDAEEDGVDADPDREGEDGDEARAGARANRTECVAEVLAEAVHQGH